MDVENDLSDCVRGDRVPAVDLSSRPPCKPPLLTQSHGEIGAVDLDLTIHYDQI